MRAPVRSISFRALPGILAIGLAAASVAAANELTDAARVGDWAAFAQILASDEPVDIDASGADGTASIHWAVQARATDTVRELIRAGVDLDATNRYGATPLSIAASDGNVEMLQLLLSSGADPAAAESALPEGQTLAMFAARTGSVASLAELAAHGAINVNAREHRNETTALMWAAIDDRAEVVRYLAAQGADPNLRSRLTNYPHLGNGVLLTPPEDGVTYAGQTPLQLGGWTALMYAARSGAVKTIAALAEAGADLNALDPLGESALTLAIINGHWPVVDVLLEAGADPNVADNVGSTPLYAAVDFHTLPETYGRPAPKPRIVSGSVPAVRRLLEAGAFVDAPLTGQPLRRQYTTGDGRLRAGATALMRAAVTADTSMMQLLLDAGADANVVANNGNTALLLAVASASGEPGEQNYVSAERATEAVRMLLSYGGDALAVDSSGRSAVHLAATSPGAPDIIALLAERGAMVNSEDDRGRKPLDLALDADPFNPETVELLRSLSVAN